MRENMRAAKRDRHRTIAAAVAETLESRRLLAGIESGILVARGTEGADTISTRRTGTDDVIVTTNGVSQTFDMDNFTGVRLEGLGGNDTFNLIDPLTSPQVENTTVLGGAGSDTVSYETRTAGIRTLGFQDPDAATSVPFLTVTSGAQVDRLAIDVETVIGGSGDDTLGASSRDQIEEVYGLPTMRFEGRDGHDLFTSPYQMRATLVGGAGNDQFESDESSQDFIYAGEGDDRVGLNNLGIPDFYDAGPGRDTLGGESFRDSIDGSGFLNLEDFDDVGEGSTTLLIANGLDNRITLVNDAPEGITVRGLGGNDTIVGGDSGERLEGGEGNDSLIGKGGNDTLDGGEGNDYGDAGPGPNTLISIESGPGTGPDPDPTGPSIEITGGVLVARGTSAADTFSVRRTGTDNVIVTVNALTREFDMDDFTGVRLEGLGADDTFNMVDALTSPVVRNATVLGGAGNDTISYATRAGALDFRIDPARSTATGGGQVDEFVGVETVIGTAGEDDFEYGNFLPIPAEQQGQSFSFRIEGRGANDRFQDEISNTDAENFAGITLLGGDGNDFFDDGANPDDVMFGDAGNDAFNKVENLAALSGGSGTDAMSFLTAGDTIDMRLAPDVETLSFTNDSVKLIIGNDLSNRIDMSGAQLNGVAIRGMGGNDTILGTGGADTLEGGDGNDSVSALAGNDSLVGGSGADTLDGGGGTDVGDGGPGNDTLVNVETQPGAGSIGRVGRTLIADGSWGEDLITIERTGADDVIVRVNETSRQFDMDDFDTVLLRGNGGFDDLRVLQPLVAGSLVRPITLLGGGGADALVGSDGSTNEVLDGGEGDDFLDTRDGFGGDTAIGGNGTDSAVVDAGDTASGVETIT